MHPDLTHFDHLEFSRQCELINQASFTDKADLILRSVSPEAILPTLTGEDYFLIYSEAGSELKPELLSLGTVDQLVFVADFECWDQDRVDAAGFLSWMDQLSQIEIYRFEKWLLETDIEMLISAYMKFAEVLKTQHLELIDDYIGDRPFFTLDNLYYICIEGEHFDVLRQGLEILFEREKSVYLTLMEGLICESESLIEEEAYQLRASRLSRYGFPEKDEAMRIYKPVTDWAMEETRLDPETVASAVSLEAPSITTPVPINNAREPLFVDKVLSLYYQKHPGDDHMQSEFVALANKIIVCEDLDFTRSDTIRSSLERARHLISVALEDLSQQSLEEGLRLVSVHYLETLYRWAITLLRRLRQDARSLVQDSGLDDFRSLCRFLGSPWNYTLRGLMRFCPMRAKPDAAMEIEEFEDFTRLEMVAKTRATLNALQTVLRFVASHFGDGWQSLLDQDYEGLNLEYQALSLNQVMATAFARIMLDGSLSFEPLTTHEIKRFIQTSFEGQLPLRRLKTKARKQFLQSLDLGAGSPTHYYFDVLFRLLEEELGSLNLRMPLEGRLLPLLLVRVEKKAKSPGL